MTQKELKRLKRKDLIEMLLSMSRENERLKIRLQTADQQLQDRRLVAEKAGSLAEMAFQLNGVFEAAQAACDQYQENIRLRCEKLEQETKEKCDRMLSDAEILVRQ